MEDNNVIKSIVPFICPHCSKDFFIELQTIPTMVSGILTPKEILNAKTLVSETILSMKISEEEKSSANDWVNKDETMFGPNDVDSIIENIKKQYEIKN